MLLAGKNIMWVDDEAVLTRPYRDRLREGQAMLKYTELRFFDSIANACEEFSSAADQYGLLLLDLQMPSPAMVTDLEMEKYVRLTGLWFFDNFKTQLIEHKVPVVILTNKDLRDYYAALESIAFPAGAKLVRKKLECPAKDLVSTILDFAPRW